MHGRKPLESGSLTRRYDGATFQLMLVDNSWREVGPVKDACDSN